MNRVIHSDNLAFLRDMKSESIDLIYIDPPFNTGKIQERSVLKTSEDADGDRTGFGGKRYKTTKVTSRGFADSFDDFMDFLA